jgi:hypothetical protein
VWRLNQKGQGGIIGAMIGFVIATITLYMALAILNPINNDLLFPLLLNGNFQNPDLLIVIWGLIPLILIFGIIITLWMNMTGHGPRNYPPPR